MKLGNGVIRFPPPFFSSGPRRSLHVTSAACLRRPGQLVILLVTGDDAAANGEKKTMGEGLVFFSSLATSKAWFGPGSTAHKCGGRDAVPISCTDIAHARPLTGSGGLVVLSLRGSRTQYPLLVLRAKSQSLIFDGSSIAWHSITRNSQTIGDICYCM